MAYVNLYDELQASEEKVRECEGMRRMTHAQILETIGDIQLLKGNANRTPEENYRLRVLEEDLRIRERKSADLERNLGVYLAERNSLRDRFQDRNETIEPCSDPFFCEIFKCRESDDWLEFSSQIPHSMNRKLYIRSSYKLIAVEALFQTDQNNRKYAVITGTPGIGKSMFIYYLVWMLVKDKKRMLLIRNRSSIYFDGNSFFEYLHLPPITNRQFWSPELWCLIDSQNPMRVIGTDTCHCCSVLLVTTPGCDYIHDFKKLVPTPTVFYMPIWTQSELEKIQHLFPGRETVWMKRFESLGGVPRYVLEDITEDPETLLLQACKSCSVDE